MYGNDYHSHSEYAHEGHRHDYEYAHEGHEHPLWQVSGAASDSHSHDLSEVWAEIETLREQITDLRAMLRAAAQDHQET